MCVKAIVENAASSKKRRPGRPSFEATKHQRAEVRALVAFGITEIDIAKYIGVSVPTLRKHFAEELELGAVQANAAVARRLFEKATKDGDTTCIIWWTKTRMGWSEKRRTELTGQDGGPVQVSTPQIFIPQESDD